MLYKLLIRVSSFTFTSCKCYGSCVDDNDENVLWGCGTASTAKQNARDADKWAVKWNHTFVWYTFSAFWLIALDYGYTEDSSGVCD